MPEQILDIDEVANFLGIKLYNLKDRRRKRRTVLLMGETGAGKTHQIWKMQQAGFRPFYINMEDGDLTLEGADMVATRVKSYERFTFVIDKLIEMRQQKKNFFDTIAIDSATQFVKAVLKYMLRTSEAVQKGNQSADVAAPRDYLRSITGIDNVFEKLGELPFNFVFLAIDDYEEDRLKRRLWQPVMFKGARASFYQYCDGIFRLTKDEEGRRFLQTDGTDDVHAKIRVPIKFIQNDKPRPPLMIEDPDLSDIFKYWASDPDKDFYYPWGTEEKESRKDTSDDEF